MNTILARVNTAEEERSVSSRYRVSPYRPRILTARVSLGQSEAWSGQAAGGTESEGAGALDDRCAGVVSSLATLPGDGLALYAIARAHHAGDPHWFFGYAPGLGPGQLYGHRVHGPYVPQQGLRFNPATFVIDPNARALAGELEWRDEGSPTTWATRRGTSRAMTATRPPSWRRAWWSIRPSDWEGDQPPRTPWHRSILYEVHVKGFTVRHPEVPEEVRRTYAGLASPAVLGYLTGLGITAVELLPVHHHVDEAGLVQRGLRNYWGYNSIAFFAPDSHYAASDAPGAQVREFKEMVKALHRAGLEVILDVVYNHTAEGNHLGPTLSFRGIDNAAYYRLVPGQPRYY